MSTLADQVLELAAEQLADEFYSATVLGGTWPEAAADTLIYTDEFAQGVMYCWIQRHPKFKQFLPNEILVLTKMAYSKFKEML